MWLGSICKSMYFRLVLEGMVFIYVFIKVKVFILKLFVVLKVVNLYKLYIDIVGE